MHNFKKYPELTEKQMQIYYFESPHKQIKENFSAKVKRVIDGDTIKVKCDFRDFEFSIRFLRTNAPELNEDGGNESKNWLKNKIEGENIEVLIDNNNRVDKWGRLLGEIMFKGISMNEESVILGHSKIIGDETGKLPQIEEVVKNVIKIG